MVNCVIIYYNNRVFGYNLLKSKTIVTKHSSKTIISTNKMTNQNMTEIESQTNGSDLKKMQTIQLDVDRHVRL